MTMYETLGRGWANFPKRRFSGMPFFLLSGDPIRFRVFRFGGALCVKTNLAQSLFNLKLYMR